MPITASEVKALRDRTGAGMMECKKALTETDGDMDAQHAASAIDPMRRRRARGSRCGQAPRRWPAIGGLVAVASDASATTTVVCGDATLAWAGAGL